MGAKKIQEGPRVHILFKIDYLKCHGGRDMSTLENTQSPEERGGGGVLSRAGRRMTGNALYLDCDGGRHAGPGERGEEGCGGGGQGVEGQDGEG